MRQTETCLRGEPPLEELMADPIVHAVMHRDGLTAPDVWRVIEQAAIALRERTRDATKPT
ncbi:MAG: hypothetical protein ACE5GS_11010 [Kiloniellaceae bacterium]